MNSKHSLQQGIKLSLDNYIDSLPTENEKFEHTKEYLEFIKNIEKQRLNKSKKLFKLLLVAAILISLLVSSFAVMGKFGSFDDVRANEMITTKQNQTSTTGIKNQVVKPTRKESAKADLLKLDIGDYDNIELISSSDRYSAFCSNNSLVLINLQNNKIVNSLLLDYKPVGLYVDDDISVISKTDDGYVNNRYDFSLTNIAIEPCEFVDDKLNGVSYFDDEKQGTLYYYPDEDAYYLTPYHKDMVVLNRFNHRFAFEEKINGGYCIKIKNYALGTQVNKLKLKSKVDISNLNNTTYSFVNANGDAYVWHYKYKKTNRRSSRVTKYSSIEMQAYVDDMISNSGLDIVFDNVSVFDQFVCMSKILNYTNEIEFDNNTEIIFTYYVPESNDDEKLYFDVNTFDFDSFMEIIEN